MLKTLLVNSDDNHNYNHMDGIRKCQVDMKILNLLKFIIDAYVTVTPDRMKDINNFLDHFASEIFERIRSISTIVFNIPDTYP